MSSSKSSKRILKPEIHGRDFDKDIEEARTLRDVDRLEKKDSRLWLLAILLILLTGLFILVKDLETLNFSPQEILRGFISFRLSALVLPAVILLLAFTYYLFRQRRKFGELRRQIFIHRIRQERARGSMEEMVALSQISSAIHAHKELNAILEMIGRESLNCLKAHRSSVFLLEEKSGILKTQFTFASDATHEQVGLFEEKEMARKAMRQKRPFLLREPGDFSDFLKYQERDRKITSLISIPLVWQEKAIGSLTAVLLDDERKFSERDLQFVVVLGG